MNDTVIKTEELQRLQAKAMLYYSFGHIKDMSKREHYASLAMQGLIADTGMVHNKEYLKSVTDMCVAYADSLIESLKVK